MIRRMMYHNHIINRDTKDTLMTDFAFMREEIDNESINKISKEQYQKAIKEKMLKKKH